jgi:hypothetical protein
VTGEQGWYPDEADPSKIRWWSGAAWADEVRDRPPGFVHPDERRHSTVRDIHPGIDSAAVAASTRTDTVASTRRFHILPWLIGLPLLLTVMVLAPVNPALTATVVGGVATLTGIWSLATARPSWARVDRRWKAVVPLVLGVALLALATVLPTSFVTSPLLLTQPPRPTQEQADALVRDWTAIEPRIGQEWSVNHTVTRAMEVCVGDYVARTPDQQIGHLATGFEFSSGSVAPDQARALLETVRTSFCGQPGARTAPDAVYTLPDLATVLTKAILGGTSTK